MSTQTVNRWWQRAFKKEAVRTTPQPSSKKGSWFVPTQFKTLQPKNAKGR